jgi:hypothetical protein
MERYDKNRYRAVQAALEHGFTYVMKKGVAKRIRNRRRFQSFQ